MAGSGLPTSMIAVVFDGPRKVSVQRRPVPKLQDGHDIIVKVQATALCGSELHVYRGHQPSETGFVMGHEFSGIVVEVGAFVKTVEIGDKVISPFTTSCMQCFYCHRGYSSRCSESALFGSAKLDGGQAEFVRVPQADGTVMKSSGSISDQALVLMADIWPTGFFGATNAFKVLDADKITSPTIIVIGCGPVGLCAIIAALEHNPGRVFAIDNVKSRLDLAEKLGAEPLNFEVGKDALEQRVKEVTEGRGADAVIEVVGLSAALRTAFDLIRPWGVISSIGVHNAEIPWSGSEAYDKNLRLQMGRCPVRSIFPEALAMLEKKQNLLGFMFDKVMPLQHAAEGYRLFDRMEVQKVIFSV